MKTISEMTDLEAEKRLTELRGWCWHVPTECEKSLVDKCKYCAYSMPYILANGFENKPYSTSYNDIIPAIQDISEKYDVAFSSWLKATPRELLNAVIEVLEQHEHDN